MTSYISSSTNRHPHAADISSASLVAFASSNLISLWNTPSDRGVFQTLAGHEGLVTCVHFLTEDLLATADDKGVLRCWRQKGSQACRLRWKSTAKAEAHAQAISSLCVHNKCLATGASDGTVKIWKVASDTGMWKLDELEEVQLLSLHGKYPLALAMTTLPKSKVEILAVAGTDRNIQIWTRSGDLYVRSAILSGHEDWVRSLAFQTPATSEDFLTLASGSQDATIRLWKIEAFTKYTNSPADTRPSDALSDDLLDAFEASLGDLVDAEEGGRQISLKRHILTVKSEHTSPPQYSITFDALLIGHEAGVTSLSWRPGTSRTSPTLLSTSTDSSLILWSPTAIRSSSSEESTSIWISRQRFGDVGGQRLGGFVGGLWARNGDEALAWGWSGGWRRWRCTSSSEEHSDEVWSEISAITGHSGPVKSLDWSPTGEYLISAGLDQTTRIHAPIRGLDGSSSWHELSRPQVHGYDVLGVAFLGPLKFVSIADEKVARVFEAPRGFVDLAERLGVATSSQHNRPVAASVPPLGLSNKAVNEAVVPVGESKIPSKPPFEGELAATTLWPETEKIFGHGYESMSLAVSGSRRLIATACKASTAEHAVVRVYDTDKWQPVGEPLSGHTLTVTRIAFSPDDRLVLSVSRDRSWRLYEVQNAGGYLPIAADKSHGRIIWDCAWASEGDIFATASRDKTVKIWRRAPDDKWIAAEIIKTKDAATAVDFSPLDSQDRRHLAVGLETGAVLVYSNAGTAASNWRLEHTLDSNVAHVGHVHRLSWRPTIREGAKELASCSEDGTLIVFCISSSLESTNGIQDRHNA
ncbi:WD40-repeat-containing domain protein [Mycena latifolia]|nr:WD40-repeat-containing domain protein [Mycena latifolia]